MAIETYMIEEAEKLICEPEEVEKWNKLVEEAGLEGQKELIKPEKSPIPFIALTKSMERVYETLCPGKEDAKAYKDSAIPLRVLSLIALSEREKYFYKIQIWSDKVKDPVVVGVLNNSYSSPLFLIARWGDELRSFPELLKLAKERLKQQKMNEYKTKISTIDESIDKHFNGEWAGF